MYLEYQEHIFPQILVGKDVQEIVSNRKETHVCTKTRTRDLWALTVTRVAETLCWLLYRRAYIWFTSSTLYIILIIPQGVMEFTILVYTPLSLLHTLSVHVLYTSRSLKEEFKQNNTVLLYDLYDIALTEEPLPVDLKVKINISGLSQNFMVTAKTMDLTCKYLQTNNSVVFFNHTHIKLIKKFKAETQWCPQ